MKILELFAGTRSIGKAFESAGHEVYSIEWDKRHTDIDWYADIGTITAQDIIERFGIPDVIWASPDCSSYSIAAISHHRTQEDDGHLAPKSEYASLCDTVNQNVLSIIKELNPKYYFIENPRGGMRKMRFMRNLPRYTVTYCQYGDTRMKPTDIWTNHPAPDFKPMCKNGDPCHVSAPRGAKTGTQGLKNSLERSIIPAALCEHIVRICENNTQTFRLDTTHLPDPDTRPPLWWLVSGYTAQVDRLLSPIFHDLSTKLSTYTQDKINLSTLNASSDLHTETV